MRTPTPRAVSSRRAAPRRPVAADASTRPLGAFRLLGATVGPYRILGPLGEGGFGVVYLAEQERPVRRRVALKVIKLGMDTSEVISRFESERQALAVMNNPNIAQVFDAGTTEEGLPYFVMEHVPGAPITDYCDRQRLSTRERLELLVPVCQAIHHAHQKGIIHRDVKPSNVLVSIQDGRPVPKVIDFGVAKAVDQRLMERSVFTEQGRLIGTPAYMSPEQAEMTGLNVDTTTDVYSLGVLMYEILVGALPFDSKALLEAGLGAMHRMIRDVDPPKPSTRLSTLGERAAAVAENRRTQPRSLEKSLRGELDWITMRAMEKDRTRRYASAAEMGADIQRFLRDEAVLARPASATYQMRKFAKRNRALVGGAAAVLAALVAGVAVSTWQAVRATRAERLAAERLVVAERERQKAEAVSRFLQGMLASADPSRMKGRQVTVGEVLDAAAKKVTDGSLKDRPDVEAEVRGTIGDTYVALGAYNEAGPHLQTGLEINERQYGAESGEAAGSLNRLAIWAYEGGDIAAAESLARAALSAGRKSLGVHRTVAVSLNNLMKFVSEQGRYEEADSLMKEILAIDQTLFGENSLEAAKDLYNLGVSADVRGASAEAESLTRESIAIYERLLGEDSPKTTFVMNGLGELLMGQNRVDEARAVFERTYEIRRRVLGDDHEETLLSLVNLGWVHRRRGEMVAAESCYRATFEGRKRTHGIDHPRTARVETQLADLLARRGAYEEAEPLFREALESRRKRLPPRNLYIGSSLNKYGWLLLDRGRIDEARPMFEECLSIWEGNPPETDLEIAEANAGMGGVLAERGRYDAAESLLVAGYEGMKSEPDAAPHRIRATLERLVGLSDRAGSADRAAEWRARLAEMTASGRR